MLVLVEDAAESVISADVESGEPARVCDRFGQRYQWPGVGDALMRTMIVVEGAILA